MAVSSLTARLGSRISGNFFKTVGAAPRKLAANCRLYAASSKIQFLERENGNKIAFYQLAGKNPSLPGIVLCSGFQSNMNGVKAMAVEEYCRQKELGYIRFDYQGCGKSTGDVRDMTLTDWRGDLMAILDQVTAGPQLIIGSSLGGWLMLFAAMERPHRIHSLVGIATAADFPTRGFSRYPKEVQEQIESEGVVVYPTGDITYVLTKKFLDDAKNHVILERETIPISCPVRLLHGMEDDTVPWDTSLQIAQKLKSKDVHCLFNKGSNHRFSQPEDIKLLFEILNYLIYGAEEVYNLAIKSWKSYSVHNHPDHLIGKPRVIRRY